MQGISHVQGNGIGADHKNMPPDLFGQLPWDHALLLLLHHGDIQVLYKGKRQKNKEEDNAGQKNGNRKQHAQIRREGDVAKSQRRHHRHRPVQACHPGVFPALILHY